MGVKGYGGSAEIGAPRAGTHFAHRQDVADPSEIDGVDSDRDAVAMIARCARHQHPELFGGREVPAEERPGPGAHEAAAA